MGDSRDTNPPAAERSGAPHKCEKGNTLELIQAKQTPHVLWHAVKKRTALQDEEVEHPAGSVLQQHRYFLIDNRFTYHVVNYGFAVVNYCFRQCFETRPIGPVGLVICGTPIGHLVCGTNIGAK